MPVKIKFNSDDNQTDDNAKSSENSPEIVRLEERMETAPEVPLKVEKQEPKNEVNELYEDELREEPLNEEDDEFHQTPPPTPEPSYSQEEEQEQEPKPKKSFLHVNSIFNKPIQRVKETEKTTENNIVNSLFTKSNLIKLGALGALAIASGFTGSATAQPTQFL
jgi:hypothetical protein